VRSSRALSIVVPEKSGDSVCKSYYVTFFLSLPLGVYVSDTTRRAVDVAGRQCLETAAGLAARSFK
jgi:hypothetical protein